MVENSILHSLDCYEKVCFSTNNEFNHYFYSCLLEQITSDLLQCAALMEETLRVDLLRQTVKRVRHQCAQLSRFHVGFDVLEKQSLYNQVKIQIYSNMRFIMENPIVSDRYQCIVDKINSIQVPECCGYDLSDILICKEDVSDFYKSFGEAAVIGVRSGGSYIAPLWAALLHGGSHETHYCTIRPLLDADSFFFVNEEMENLPNCKKFVILDDQIDTGKTAIAVSDMLRRRFGHGIQVYFSSPGRICELPNQTGYIKDIMPLYDSPRKLWQGNKLERNNNLTQWFAKLGINAEGAGEYTYADYVSRYSQEYQTDKQWEWWGDYTQIKRPGPRRVNPRKTPLVAYCNGEPRYHIKFIGQGVFGEAEYEKIKRFQDMSPLIAAYQDGYLVTEYKKGLSDFKLVYHMEQRREEKKQLLQQAAHYFDLQQEYAAKAECRHLGKNKLEQFIRKLCDEFQIAQNIYFEETINSWMHHKRNNTLCIRSSLPYAPEYWHWQVQQLSAGYKVYKFHIDSIWGKVVSLETELASFLIVNDIELEDMCYICKQLQYPMDVLQILSHVPEAIMYSLQPLLRRKNEFTYKDRAGEHVMMKISSLTRCISRINLEIGK